MKIIKGIIYLINMVVVVFTLLSYVAPFVDPSKFWAFSFFGLLFPILLFANIFFIIFWFFASKKKMLLSIFTLLIGYNNVTNTVGIDLSKSDKSSGITIMSYNINHGNYKFMKKHKKGDLGGFLNSQDVDLLFLQEINSSSARNELSEVNSFKYKYIEKKIGTGIISKYPIIKSGKIDFNLNTNSCVWADIKIKKDTFRVYSVHFQSNKVSRNASELVKDIEKEKAVKSKDIRLILSKYKNNVQVRANQVKKVKEHISNSPYKIILGGDFNDPSVTYTYHEFSEILKDSFKEKGFGMGISYAGSIPFLRIDYILVSPSIKVIDYKTLENKYSDHYAIKSILEL